MRRQVVVIGGGQGGLCAAIEARLAGHDVLLLEQRDSVGGKAAAIEQSGYRLDPGPSIIILTRIYRSFFEAAGRKMEDYLRFQRLDPFTRVFMEGQGTPLDLPGGREECLRVLGDWAPEDAGNLRRMMDTLDKVGPHIDASVFDHPYHKPWQLADPHLIATALHFDVRSTYRELVDRWFQSPLLRAFFYGFPSYGGQTYDSKAPGALMIPYLMIQEGVFYPEGGVAAIPRAFARLAEELGVVIRSGSRVVGMEADGGRVRSVLLESGERVEADAFVSNRDRLATREWLGRRVDWAPSLSYFTIHWGVRAKLANVLHHTLLIPKSFERGFEQLYRERVFPNDPIIYLNETSAVDPSVAPAGCSNLFAVVTSPARVPGVDWSDSALADGVEQCLGRYGIEVGEPDFRRVQTPVTFEERDGNYRGSLYGPDEAHRVFGLFPLRVCDEEFRNLFYAGGSVQPGAGLPMVSLSGRFAAQQIC